MATAAAKKEEKKYRYFINNAGKTLVVGTQHPNVNIWLMPGIPLKITEMELEHSNIDKLPGIEEITDAKIIAKALRPDKAHHDYVTSEEKKKDDCRKKLDRDDTGGFNEKPKEAKLGPGLTVNEINAR